MLVKINVFIFLIALIAASGCQSKLIDNSGTIVEVEMVSFSDDVLPIFMSSCGGSGCHINEAASGVELTTFQAAINSEGASYGRRVIDPGNDTGSPLVEKLFPSPDFGSQMPIGAPALSTDQVTTIRTWIREGALDN